MEASVIQGQYIYTVFNSMVYTTFNIFIYIHELDITESLMFPIFSIINNIEKIKAPYWVYR